MRNGKLPDYLVKSEVDALIAAGEDWRAQLFMTVQWQAGLRISEALGLRIADLRFVDANPTVKVAGKGGKERYVPAHERLIEAISQARFHHPEIDKTGRLFAVSRRTASRWVERARDKAIAAGDLPEGARVSTHTLRHSFARHMLASQVPINELSNWLGHSQLSTTLIYSKLVPGASGTMDGVEF